MYSGMLKFDLNDIVLVPVETSEIDSRKECDIYDSETDFLPLFASPMDTVVSSANYLNYIYNNIMPCLPRGNADKFLLYRSRYFIALGLSEIEKELKNENNAYNYFRAYPNILIDIAHGHMRRLLNVIEEIRSRYPDVVLMVGNVANPETFINLGLMGVQYVRCSVGTGAGCTTAANVSINYPLGSLISECYEKRSHYDIKTKIVADGGMRNYSDIIKALALGADYVMIGSLFNKAIESAGYNYLWNIRINNKMAEFLWKYDFPIKKKYRGMSTKAVQRSWGKTHLVTAEGITKYQRVEYTLPQWIENFSDYLRSAMSYCGARTLDEFKGKAEYVFITNEAKKRFDK